MHLDLIEMRSVEWNVAHDHDRESFLYLFLHQVKMLLRNIIIYVIECDEIYSVDYT